jgi:hypothetical protein
VADPAVIYPDLEDYLIGWYRTALAARPEAVCAGVVVARTESEATPPPKKQLIIRDDGTTRETFITGQASIGMTVLAGTKANPKDAKALAAIVLSLASQIPSPDPDNPFASLDAATGPYMVPEAATVARVYSTATFSVAGRPL